MRLRKDPPRRRASGRGRRAGRFGAIPLLFLLLTGAVQSGSESVLEAGDAVFVGSLRERNSFWSEDGRFIWTRHVFEVEESLLGSLSATVEIFELGGTVGDVSLWVSHPVAYEYGPAYLIIARRDDRGRLQTWGGLDGRLPILEDGSGKRLVRVRAGSPLSDLLGEPRRVLYDLGEARALFRAGRTGTGVTR